MPGNIITSRKPLPSILPGRTQPRAFAHARHSLSCWAGSLAILLFKFWDRTFLLRWADWPEYPQPRQALNLWSCFFCLRRCYYSIAMFSLRAGSLSKLNFFFPSSIPLPWLLSTSNSFSYVLSWDNVSLYSPGWSQTHGPLASAFWVAKITSMHFHEYNSNKGVTYVKMEMQTI